ncbi:MAG: V-type ATPase subunit [Clostridiaceae bacterium]|nr:V-type ATPase subunit [Clostridiaceae bacterium]
MLKEIKYGALSGKSRAMYGKLLNRYDYESLMQKKNISEVFSYLKHNTRYSEILSEIEESDVHRVSFENALKKDIMRDYSKFFKCTGGQLKEFINIHYRKVEIESLKLIIRAFEAGNVDHTILEESLIFLTKNDKLNIPKLALSKDLEEFHSRLRGTSYYELLKPFISDNVETRLFNIEMTLDLYYIRSIKMTYEKLLDKDDSAIIKELLGIEADIFNIFWIYRGKNFYDISNEVIKSYSAHITGKLNKKIMASLMDAVDLEEYLSILKKTPYGFLFAGQDQLLFEHNYLEYIYRVHKRYFRRQPFSVACIVSYLRLKELELTNIISIIEGIRYGLSVQEIQKFVAGMNL